MECWTQEPLDENCNAIAAGAVLLLSGLTAWALESSAKTASKLSADALWSKIGDFCGISNWHPAVEKCELSAALHFSLGGGTIVEALVKMDAAGHSYTYSIVSSPLPVANYTSTIGVAADGAGSVMTWAHRSALLALGRLRPLSLQRLHVARCGLLQQLLQSTSVIQSALHLGHELFGHVDCNPPPLLPAVQDVTWMLLPRHTGRTILAHAGTAAKAQGPNQRRPKPRCFALQPANDVGRSFESGVLHI